MKKYLLIIALVGSAVSMKAQQLQTSSLYDLQGTFANPAMAGLRDKALIGITYRTQWSGISGAPKTATAFGSMALPEQKIGLGAYIYNDQTGPTSRTGITAQFAKHIIFADDSKLSFGIEARAEQYSIDVEKLQQSLGTSDPVLAGGDNKFKFDAGFGVAYEGKNLELGASVAQLVQSKLGYYTGNLTPTEEGKLYRHYYLHGGYKFRLDPTAVIMPNFLMIYMPNAPTELQIGARVEHNDVFWWGVGYRINQSFILSAGAVINKKLRIGYAFDIYQHPVGVFDTGGNAHEMLVSYNFGK